MASTIDVNTSGETVEGTPPGRTFSPLRYTTTLRDTIRVGLWMVLSTNLGTYQFDTSSGVDMDLIMDPSTSDAERSAQVGDVILAYSGVVAITEGPTVILLDGGTTVSITVTAETIDGPITLTA